MNPQRGGSGRAKANERKKEKRAKRRIFRRRSALDSCYHCFMCILSNHRYKSQSISHVFPLLLFYFPQFTATALINKLLFAPVERPCVGRSIRYSHFYTFIAAIRIFSFSFVRLDFAPRLTFIPSACFVLLCECAASLFAIFLASPFLRALATVHRAHCAWRSSRVDENFLTRLAALFPSCAEFVQNLFRNKTDVRRRKAAKRNF